MSIAPTRDRLELPESLRAQLDDFRRRVWTTKLSEAGLAAAFAVLAAYLVLFVLDRFAETPGWARAGLSGAAALGLAGVPLAWHRWVWRRRRPDQLARLLARRLPRLGDQLLGVIELVRSDSEQARSRALCEAAVRQVADDARGRDLRAAAPTPRHRAWARLCALPAAAALALLAACPAAATNAWARLAAPWRDVPRYTFAALAPLPERLVVAHGEPFAVAAELARASAWSPARGEARLGDGEPVVASLRDGRYEFELPARIDPAWLDLRVGDARRRLRVEPALRPELTAVVAEIALPDYLGRPEPLTRDARGGSIAPVKGSRVRVSATASRELAEAEVDGRPAAPSGATVTGPARQVDAPATLEIRWRDALGLAGKEPFSLSIAARDDEPPTLAAEGLPRRRVVIDSEQLAFRVRAADDFGVRRVGLEWQRLDDAPGAGASRGEKILAAGDPAREALELGGTFSARALGIAPQPLSVRVFVEDYLPGRPRVYSPPSTLYVLDPEQHAIWLTEQLSLWHRQSLEVRDRELQLHEANKQLRGLPADELDRPETRRRIEAQASAERANGRRLSGLVGVGEDLVLQATRNPEFGVGHLETWAEMLQVLKDIAGNRMPSVADLLKDAAQAPTAVAGRPGPTGPAAGQVRSASPGAGGSGPKAGPPPGPPVPRVVDAESSQQPAGPASDGAPKPGGGSPRLGLAATTVAGPPKPGDDDGESPAAPPVAEAVERQRDLLAEFDKIAEELNRVLANLEGSTLVKRLKAASRAQYAIAGRVADQLGAAFGAGAGGEPPDAAEAFRVASEEQAKGSLDVSRIMDDMQAYSERRQVLAFRSVLDEMRKLDAIGSLRQIGDDLRRQQGVSIAQCEFWSDTLDRWAEDLVDPACSGQCPGSKSRGSLPPSVVLEVLQILEAEVALREATREAEQARPALEAGEFGRRADALSADQGGIRGRVDAVVDRILELPDAEAEFGPELGLLRAVSGVMGEAAEILARPEAGPPAIAAETEAIELLLRSKRINPKAGGGSGPSPGGGGSGTTQDSAITLLGKGLNEKEVREDRGVAQATGEAGSALPEEFRAGLDEYFQRLERGPAGR